MAVVGSEIKVMFSLNQHLKRNTKEILLKVHCERLLKSSIKVYYNNCVSRYVAVNGPYAIFSQFKQFRIIVCAYLDF